MPSASIAVAISLTTRLDVSPKQIIASKTGFAPQVALVIKYSPANVGDLKDLGSILGLGRFPERGHATHSSILAWRIPMD